ncbi:sensor histidine kinase [Streptomyces goshikiensis]|uniref:sensor histidine kinase n=1 Tax=Streptomyces goshikiensis TaxID=1942 RepID=UPI002E13BC8D|nr:histidine kinase [Streptomyces goshikiensis]WSS01312.1 histidine kinase [Streptomyces goshikiensis]
MPTDHPAVRSCPLPLICDLLLLAAAASTALVLFEWVDSWGVSGLFGPAAYLTATCCAAVAVLIRRRWPSVALATAATVSAVEPLTGGALVVVAYTAGSRWSGLRRRVVLVAVSVAAPAAITMAISAGQPTSIREYEATVVIVTGIVCGALPGLVGALSGQRERLIQALRERNTSLERANRSAEEQARSRERARIVGEMHDLLGHRLSLVALHSGGLEMASEAGDPEIHQTAVLVHSTVRQAMRELRGVLGVLRAENPGTGASEPLTDATGTHSDVAALVSQSRAAGIAVGLNWTGSDLVDGAPATRRAVHGVVREAMTNVHKHAAGASVTVTVLRDTRQVWVQVRNGSEPAVRPVQRLPGSALGLAGLHERLRLLGGTLRAGPTHDGGYCVDAHIPLNADPAATRTTPDTDEGPEALAAAQTWLHRTAAATVMGLGVVGAVALQFVTLAFVPTPADDEGPSTFEQSGISSEDAARRRDPVGSLAPGHGGPVGGPSSTTATVAALIPHRPRAVGDTAPVAARPTRHSARPLL